MTFTQLALIEPLLRALDVLGYHTPTPVQAQAIPAVLAGRDLMAAAQTGTGKTAGFALPLLQRLAEQSTPVGPQAVRVLVLVPTRELAEQVFSSFCDYGHFLPLKYAVAYGGVGLGPQVTQLRHGVDVLVATPGRLLDLLWKKAVRFDEVQTLVLDEADRMLDLGFARELDQVFAALTRRRQTLLFSATFSDAIRSLSVKLLHSPERIEVSPRNSTVQGVKQWLVTCDKKRKTELFSHLLKKNAWSPVLVFVRTRKGAETLLETLLHQGFNADAIHGDKAQAGRQRALSRFKSGEVSILVATDVAARGLDIDDLPIVINFDMPSVAEDYVHRIGRTGRAGAGGLALSLVCADEVKMLAAIEALIRQTIKRVEEPGFAATHRVGQTAPEGQQVLHKPKKPQKPRAPGATAGAKRKPLKIGRSGGRAAAGKAPGSRPAKPAAKPRSR